MKKLLALLLTGLFAMPGLAFAATQVAATGFPAEYRISDESFVTVSNGELDRIAGGNFLSYAVDFKNPASTMTTYKNTYFLVDGWLKAGFSEFSLGAGQSTRLHIYNVNMQKLLPGLHSVELYTNGEKVLSDSFHIVRAWSRLMTIPSNSQISAANNKGRSPYVVYYPKFQGTNGVTEYSIDFWVDDVPNGTYFSTMDATMDVSSLKNRYASVYNDYNDAGGFYCGFQKFGNGKTAIIMSVWDNFVKDKNGNVSAIRAKEIYPGGKTTSSGDKGEGSFQQYLQEFSWYPKHAYRMLMQSYTSQDTGNTVLDFWVCDLETMGWYRIVAWDLGYRSDFIRTSDLAGFMENYITAYSGDVRTVSFSNIRGRAYESSKWIAAKDVRFTVNNSISKLDYQGSYNFGSDESSFWIITSGVSNLCRQPSSGSTYSVMNATTDSPY